MTGDRERGVAALKNWYDVSNAADFYTFDQVVASYDSKHPTFLENFGGAVRVGELSTDRMGLALRQLYVDSDSGKLPDYHQFFEALQGEVTTLRFEDYKAIAEQTIHQTVSTVEKAAVVGIAAYGLWIAGGLLVFYLMNRVKAA